MGVVGDQTLIAARGLEREYRTGGESVHALAGVTIDIAAGEMAAIVGRSGSGKSTLLNLIGGLDRPTAGSLSVAGRDLAGMSREELARYRATTVGFVFQSFHLMPRYTAWENVSLPLMFQGVGEKERRAAAMPLLEQVGLGARAMHTPAEMSGGEQQRVALARALVSKPKLLLGDEPTGNLDTATSEQIMDLIAAANAAGTTVLFVTHDLGLAWERARRVIRMADGKVIGDEKV
jgi:putative ABC transport system ATP-binding protein